MIATIEHPLGNIQIDLSQPIDLAVPMHRKGPRAWYADAMWIRPVINRYFTGSVALGGKVNFNDIYFNPHAHGTHTETVGHITRDLVSIENALLKYWWLAKLISITPELLEVDSERMKKGDRVIMLKQLKQAIGDERPEALLIRTPTPTSFTCNRRLRAGWQKLASNICSWICLPLIERRTTENFWRTTHFGIIPRTPG